jgi:AcrR family transcriptional regulator
MHKVSSRLGLTEAALYRYFPTMDDLILAIHDHLNESQGQATRQYQATFA